MAPINGPIRQISKYFLRRNLMTTIHLNRFLKLLVSASFVFFGAIALANDNVQIIECVKSGFETKCPDAQNFETLVQQTTVWVKEVGIYDAAKNSWAFTKNIQGEAASKLADLLSTYIDEDVKKELRPMTFTKELVRVGIEHSNLVKLGECGETQPVRNHAPSSWSLQMEATSLPAVYCAKANLIETLIGYNADRWIITSKKLRTLKSEGFLKSETLWFTAPAGSSKAACEAYVASKTAQTDLWVAEADCK
jgi:hypothetical protein